MGTQEDDRPVTGDLKPPLLTRESSPGVGRPRLFRPPWLAAGRGGGSCGDLLNAFVATARLAPVELVGGGRFCPSTVYAKARTASVIAATVAPMVASRVALLADVIPVALLVRRAAAPAPPASALDAAGAGVAIDVVVMTVMACLCNVANVLAADVPPMPPTATAVAAALVDAVVDVSAAPAAPATAADVAALVAALPLAMVALTPATASAARLWVLQRRLPPSPAGSAGSGDHGAGAPHDRPAAAVRARR